MKIYKAAFACGALAFAIAASAQVPMVVVDHPSTATTLRAGTPVRLRLIDALTSKQAKTGQSFDLEVVDDVMVDGHIVIARGSPARGEVTFAKNKGNWGKSGKLDTQVVSVNANGNNIALRGTIAQKGETGTVGVVAAIAFLPIAGFFVSGTSAEIAAGTPYSGYVVNDIPLAFAATAVAPTVPVASTGAVTTGNNPAVINVAVVPKR